MKSSHLVIIMLLALLAALSSCSQSGKPNRSTLQRVESNPRQSSTIMLKIKDPRTNMPNYVLLDSTLNMFKKGDSLWYHADSHAVKFITRKPTVENYNDSSVFKVGVVMY